MDITMGLAGAIALGAALVVMYVVLRRYTYPAVEQPFFSDPSLFFLFTIGLIEGTILFVAYTYVFPWYTVSGLGLIVAILFGVVTELVKLVTLNLRRYSGKSDTVFYGFGLGLGLGAAMGFGIIYFWSSQLEMDAASWAIVIVFSLQNIFLHSGTGIRVGEGVARKRPMEFLMLALFVNMAFQVLMALTYSSLSSGDQSLYILSYVLMAAAFILVVANFYIMVWKKLPGIIDDILKGQGKKRNDIPGL